MYKLFVIGNPVEHSMSPLIHNFWLKKYSINGHYDKKKLEINELKNLINDVRDKKIKGLNVTIPFKKKIIDLVDEVDDTALLSMAINTVYYRNGKVIGANTDGIGFFNSLEKDLNFKIGSETDILILGAGGAAYGILAELINHEVNSIQISNRTNEKVDELINHFRTNKNILINNFKALKWKKKSNIKSDLVINTTSCGMNPDDNFNFDLNLKTKNSLVYDIIYKPSETPLMKKAKSRDVRNINGIFMLIRQAAESFQKWFGIKLNNEDIQSVKKILRYHD